MRYPDKPRRGDKVAVLSPSSALPAIYPAPFELGLRRLQDRFGLQPVEFPTTRLWGSTPRQRAEDVHAAFADPDLTAILTSIGGDDQIKVLNHLDPGLLAANPKPFFGLSDNTNLAIFLWNLGIVSYYGGTVMTMLGRAGALDEQAATTFESALFTHDWHDLHPATGFTDMGKDWADPANLETEPELLPGEGWSWHGPSTPVEGRLWGGCLEILDFHLRAARHLQDNAAYDGCVLFLETSEEMPSAQYVHEVLMGMGERGLLQRFSALVMGRPKAWNFDRASTPDERRIFVTEQHEAVLRAMEEYHPGAPIVLDVDLGHTDPQLVVPVGGECRLDPARGTISVRY